MGISDRGTKAKSITSCDNAFVTNILLAQAAHRTPSGSFALCECVAATTIVLSVRKRSGSNNCFLCESVATATIVLSVRKRSGSNNCFICAKAKRQQQLFYLCESEAAATTNVFCSGSEAAATWFSSVRKRSDSNTKAPSRNGNQPLIMVMNPIM
ncbi:hypothetical protein [Lysinibacillus sp. G4S2]|uniref:hypothetical protein n=1 Tax=Lysinibacillus sp. G4S2 TaxID=3055859 RepID=UPI0025A13327|nr:hypothetical protein [Lysinibacillus sp. G4S2]MDM5249820.1 hypothetical protein [Lysinibacillus sp. G4S2]